MGGDRNTSASRSLCQMCLFFFFASQNFHFPLWVPVQSLSSVGCQSPHHTIKCFFITSSFLLHSGCSKLVILEVNLQVVLPGISWTPCLPHPLVGSSSEPVWCWMSVSFLAQSGFSRPPTSFLLLAILEVNFHCSRMCCQAFPDLPVLLFPCGF